MAGAPRAATRFGLLAIAGIATSCASWFDEIGYFDMAPRLAYQGFSFDRPPNPFWYLRQSEETHTSVTLRRHLPVPSATHTFYARVALASLPSEPTSHAEFAEMAAPGAQEAPYEVRETSRRTELATRQGQWCIRYETEHRVRGAPAAPDRELVLLVRGERCLHPGFPRAVLDLHYSERGLPEELDSRLHEEGEAFLRGVRMDVAPGGPAGGSALAPPSR